MHFYGRMKQKFFYIYLFVVARRFYRFLKNFPNVGYDILERGYRHITLSGPHVSRSEFDRHPTKISARVTTTPEA